MKYIFHHLGLGDHIICNGMVRFYKQKYGEISVFCKPHNFDNVKYMYRDDDNIKVIPVGETHDVDNYISKHNLENDTFKIGFSLMSLCNNDKFDSCFYSISKIPFEYRFSKFHFLRDYEMENIVYRTLNPNNEDYIFVHGNVDKNKIKSNLKVINNPENFKIFDILKIIENATEVHIMESSIKCLINSYVFEKPKFYYHQYIRQYDESYNSQGKNNFITIY